MKKLFQLSVLALFVLFSFSLKAQSDERNKIQMVVSYEGKTITADLASLGVGISRYKNFQDTTENATKEKNLLQGSYYLTMTVKKISNDFLKLMSKKQTVFNGTITITDTYGKNPPREIKFSNAALDSYSDQFSSTTYDDGYSSAAVSLSAGGLTINGVVME